MSIDREKLAELAKVRPFYKGRYRNFTRTASHGLSQLLKWQTAPGRRFPKGKEFPLIKPDAQALVSAPDAPQLTWIGHSSFLFQFAQCNVLTDPVFAERASPLTFAGPKRYTDAAMQVADLPRIDIVLLSHDHYDHLCEKTVTQLHARFGDELLFCIPEGLTSWFAKRGIHNVVELRWWQSATIPQGEVFCVPAQHFSGRGPFDRNASLWCGWIFEIQGYRLFFAGDTGYGPVFETIGELFAPIDLALIPIGAYDPRWFMGPVHVAPEDSVRIHRDIGAKQSIAMHWGAFVLTDEPMDEPPQKLQQALQEQNIDADAFLVMAHGQTLQF
ncbi:MAG: MBL fold metallo-hydrolase [Alcanivoracaceae bacterium]|nr:MBL fold metallo-hydrolase [Alcanivoracaceae bacterium]